jgi:hypothetical protein
VLVIVLLEVFRLSLKDDVIGKGGPYWTLLFALAVYCSVDHGTASALAMIGKNNRNVITVANKNSVLILPFFT